MNITRNIVVLDGFTLNPGDLSWKPLAELGQLTTYDRTPPELCVERAQNAEILFTNKTILDAQTIAALPKLKYIGLLSTGTNVVDLDAAAKQGIVVTNVPGYGPDAVAQMAFAHILHHTQQVALHHEAVAAGQWTQSIDFCFTLTPLTSLNNKVLGIIGYGEIGAKVAQIALAFGMTVLVNSRRKRSDLPAGITWASRSDIYQQADVISLHCPLTPETEKMINTDSIAEMKQGAILINMARGGLIDEPILAAALNVGKIRAGVDVLSSEPPAKDNPLLTAKNISISPHNSWATIEARQNLLDIAVANLSAYLETKTGKLINQVN